MARKTKIPKTVVKRGRRIYGHIYHFADRDIYVASRKQSEVFRSGKMTISEAVRNGVAAWAIDEETLGRMRQKGIKYVAVQVKEFGDLYVTKLENFYNRSLSKFLDFSKRGGAAQRYLPLQYFLHIPATAKIR